MICNDTARFFFLSYFHHCFGSRLKTHHERLAFEDVQFLDHEFVDPFWSDSTCS